MNFYSELMMLMVKFKKIIIKLIKIIYKNILNIKKLNSMMMLFMTLIMIMIEKTLFIKKKP